MKRFKIGQKVRSLVTAQGIVEGEFYTVVHIQLRHTPFGTFVTYFLHEATGSFSTHEIGNGHLVLTEAN